MLRIDCFRCKNELDEPGALIFNPPNKYDEVIKFHICRWCWSTVRKSLFVENDKNELN